MQSYLKEDHILCLPNILSHNKGWNGSICDNPIKNECGPGNLTFRNDHCAKNIPLCNYLSVFNEKQPFLKVKGSILGRAPTEVLDKALAGQLLILVGKAPLDYKINHVIAIDRATTVFGMYRIKEIKTDNQNTDFARIIPYPDGWCRFPKLVTPLLHWEHEDIQLGNIRSASASKLSDLLTHLSAETELEFYTPEDKVRLKQVIDSLNDWRVSATNKVKDANDTLEVVFNPQGVLANSTAPINAPFKRALAGFQASAGAIKPKAKTKRIKPSPAADSESSTKPASHWENALASLSEKNRRQLKLAWRSKSLIIFAGEPGSGKSRLARSLAAPEDCCIISVSSAWQGKEDLLGYYNPVNQQYHPSPFCKFLIKCEEAWKQGHHETKLVVLEEMNLAQPEHYLSDILVKSEYDVSETEARTIVFEGSEVEGHAGRTNVFISPVIKFVGTINTDHTVRRLSARVMDRAAVIRIDTMPRAVIKQLQIDIPNEMAECICDLNEILEARYKFSYRTGRSLKEALQMLSEEGVDAGKASWMALDLVMMQEIMPRISSSFQDDFNPTSFFERLSEWAAPLNDRLILTNEVVDKWRLRLEIGSNLDTHGV